MSIFSPLNGVRHWTRFGLSSALLAARSGVPQDEVEAHLPPVRGQLPEQNGAPIVFTAADPIYLHKHAEGLTESLARVSDDLRLHIHIMQRQDDECDNAVRHLKRLMDASRLTVSCETCTPRKSHPSRQAQFYQVRRMQRLTGLLETVNSKLLAIDIDVMFSRSPATALKEWPDHDLTLQVNLGPLRPTPLTCACMIIQPSALTQRVFRAATDEMLLHLNSSIFVDHLDERCLSRAIIKNGDIELVALPDNFCTSKYAGETIFDGEGRNKARLAERVRQDPAPASHGVRPADLRENCMIGRLKDIRRRKSWSKAAMINLLMQVKGTA